MTPAIILTVFGLINVITLFLRGTFVGELTVSFLPLIVPVQAVLLIGLLILFYARFQKSLFLTLFLTINLIVTMQEWASIRQFYSSLPAEHAFQQSEKITLFIANINHDNKNYEEIKSRISTHDPDIVVLIEYADHHHKHLSSFMQDMYSHYSTPTKPDSIEPYIRNAIFSTYPVSTEVFTSNGYYKSTFHISENDLLTFYSVHTNAPVSPSYFSTRNDQLSHIAQKASDCNSYCIVAGDLNVSPWSPHYTSFEKSLGRFYTNKTKHMMGKFTWTMSNTFVVKSHIDHMFTTQNISTAAIKKVFIPGSDHTAFILELALKHPS